MTGKPPIAIQAAQALTASLAFAGLLLLAAVARGVILLLSPDSRAVFEQTTGGDANSAAYSVILGYGVPIVVFMLLYGVVALRITRGRRWTWVLGMLLAITGVVLCYTTVSKLLSFVGLALGAFQLVLAVLLLASLRYFWSATAAPVFEPDSASEEDSLEAPSVEAEPSS